METPIITIRDLIKHECEYVKQLLLKKNESYGDSASNPISIFAKGNPLDLINVRIDDKLSRIAKGSDFGTEDTELDLIGYLILKRVVQAKEKHDTACKETYRNTKGINWLPRDVEPQPKDCNQPMERPPKNADCALHVRRVPRYVDHERTAAGPIGIPEPDNQQS